MAGNPYNSPFTPTGTLSGYFEKEKAKGTKAGGASPYSAPAEPVGGSVPSGGGSAGGPSAPKGAAGGGTGFVSFGQYFGANAPAIQQQAQQAVANKTYSELDVLQKPGGYEGGSAFDQMLGGGVVQREAEAQRARQGAADIARIQAEQAAQQQARAQAVQQQREERQQYMEEEPPESRKSRSRPVGSRFDGYFNE